MEAMELLVGRVSCPKVSAPAPDAEQLAALLQAAVSAPDHGRLRPWRFLLLQGKELARLGDIFLQSALHKTPDMDDAARERVRAKALRAPLVMVVAAEITTGHKVPVEEQVHAAVCAAEHVMLAAHALGLGAMWRTGDAASDPLVKRALGFREQDAIVAFIYLGTPVAAPESGSRPDPQDFVRRLP